MKYAEPTVQVANKLRGAARKVSCRCTTAPFIPERTHHKVYVILYIIGRRATHVVQGEGGREDAFLHQPLDADFALFLLAEHRRAEDLVEDATPLHAREVIVAVFAA
jgi:hypothetical protein